MAVTNKTIRRDNFRELLKTRWGGHRPVAAFELGFGDPSLVTRYLGHGESWKGIGDELARKIERVAGVEPGWLDLVHRGDDPPRTTARPSTLEERVARLPDPLRQYLMLELQLCESAAPLFPADFTKAPTAATRRQFQTYLNSLADTMHRRTA
jgi:hypothetical protein